MWTGVEFPFGALCRQTGAGPDIILTLHNWPHLYASSLADVSDLCEWKAKDQGGYYEQSEAAARDGQRWLALPYGIVGNRWRTGNRGSPPWSGTRMIGYAGPANAKAGEVYSKYVIADMSRA